MTNEEEIAKQCYEQFQTDCGHISYCLPWKELPKVARQGWVNLVIRLGTFFCAINIENPLEEPWFLQKGVKKILRGIPEGFIAYGDNEQILNIGDEFTSVRLEPKTYPSPQPEPQSHPASEEQRSHPEEPKR